MGRGASNFSLGRAASEDMGEGLNVGLVGGSREGTLGGLSEGWEGKEPTKGQLFSRTKSGKYFSVLHLRKFFFSMDQLIGCIWREGG